mmetsp:Transcript_13924/g.50708  ORF Transcript_13924/g.50708 Transcript_13924/m.50708 type:complete len:286 (+) Transcript_13924:708-1565(+)
MEHDSLSLLDGWPPDREWHAAHGVIVVPYGCTLETEERLRVCGPWGIHPNPRGFVQVRRPTNKEVSNLLLERQFVVPSEGGPRRLGHLSGGVLRRLPASCLRTDDVSVKGALRHYSHCATFGLGLEDGPSEVTPRSKEHHPHLVYTSPNMEKAFNNLGRRDVFGPLAARKQKATPDGQPRVGRVWFREDNTIPTLHNEADGLFFFAAAHSLQQHLFLFLLLSVVALVAILVWVLVLDIVWFDSLPVLFAVPLFPLSRAQFADADAKPLQERFRVGIDALEGSPPR